MRRLQLLLIVLVAGSFLVYGQNRVTIDNFDSLTPDSASVHWMAKEAKTVFTLKFDATDKVQGTGSLKVWANLDSVHQWGTYAQFGYTLPDSVAPWDWSLSDSISLWVKVRTAPTIPGNMVFRLSFQDKPTASDPKEEYIYENASLLSHVNPGWVNLKVPFFERAQNAGGTLVPDSTGFILAPTSWGGFTYNNKALDRNKIVGWTISIVTTGWNPTNNIPPDSILVSFDNYERFGMREVPFVIFNGKAFPPPINAGTSPWSWGNSSASIETNAGPVAHSNAVKWVQGDQYGNGWTGWGVDINPRVNMGGGWQKDSLKFMMKAAPGVGAMRAQFESADSGKLGFVFTPTADSVWHSYAIPLRNFVPRDLPAGNTFFFDSTAVYKFNIMAEATGISGKVVYITNIWTGNPIIDVIPPDAPTGFQANYSTFTNLLTWNAVTNKPGCTYNVYYSDHAWTDPLDPKVEDIPPYSLSATLANHVLRAPATDQPVTYYYGVVAKDQSGNISAPMVLTTAPVATAKGVPTISLTPPTNFVANGDISEWTAANIKPTWLSVVTGTAHGVPNKLVTNDADLSVNAYLAVDATNLYVAFDVTDDHVVADTSGVTADYMNDSPDLFIGLYDWRGKHHDGYARGATPDYHLRFSKNRIWIDNAGVELMHRGNPNYAWVEKSLTSGYVVEAKIPLALLASKIAGDAVFTPKLGMRIPIDFAINDRDDPTNPAGGADARHAIMCYSTITNDNSWQAQYFWTNTWLGNAWVTGVQQTGDVPKVYSLSQNYPNPFNPSTQIRYSLAKAGMVSLKVYDILGREIATLVNEQQAGGSYTITFSSGDNGRSLATGVYFYRLESGSFVSVHKMMILK
jgi:hypothetical protein